MPTPKRTDSFYQAQDILSRRDHSENELRTKMRRKGFAVEIVEEVVTKLKKIGLIDDEKFADSYVKNILLFKPVGPRWIKHKLKEKGIESEIIDRTVENNFPAGREAELAAQAVATWRRTHQLKSGERDEIMKHRQRLTRYLAARGFSYAAIEFGMNQ